MLTTCTDLTPSEQVIQNKAFKCSDSPDGYTEDDGICVGSYNQLRMVASVLNVQNNTTLCIGGGLVITTSVGQTNVF